MNQYILVRHGESEFNLKRLHQGRSSNVPLTPDGIQQAVQLAQQLENHGVTLIYFSPLLRAKHTAEIIQARLNNPTLSFSHRLTEHQMSKTFEGLSIEKRNSLAEFQEWFTRFNSGDKHFKLTDGESLIELETRVRDFIEYAESVHRDETILIVTHKAIIAAIFRHFEQPYKWDDLVHGKVFKIN